MATNMASLEKYEDETIQPFLDGSNHNDGRSSNHCSCSCEGHQNSNANRPNLLVGFIACLVLLNILSLFVFFYFLHSAELSTVFEQTYFSPIGPLKYEWKLLGSPFKNNPFTGEPRPEVDKAWGDLLRNAQINITADELAQTYTQSSIPLADGSGYVAELGVYHYLHCLKRIKQNLHLDYYQYSEYENRTQILHIDHCIELLREALMCNADTSFMTFRWVEELPEVPVTDLWSKHQCVKWDTVESWADERRLNLSEPGLIIRPLA